METFWVCENGSKIQIHSAKIEHNKTEEIPYQQLNSTLKVLERRINDTHEDYTAKKKSK